MLIDKISSYLNENSPFHFTFVKWFASQFCHYRSTFVHLNFFAVAYFSQLFHPPHLFFQLSTCDAMSYIHQSNSEFLSSSGSFFLFLALFFSMHLRKFCSQQSEIHAIVILRLCLDWFVLCLFEPAFIRTLGCWISLIQNQVLVSTFIA